MSTCQTAKRRRQQAKNGYRHICKQKRPIYRKKNPVKSKRADERAAENRRRGIA